MTDARHPERWLMDRRIQRLTAEHYRAFSMSLMYAVSNRTDGHLTTEDLEAVPHFKAESIDALVAADLWTTVVGGWVITDYLTTQTTRAQLEAAENARLKDAERKARERAGKRGATTRQASEDRSPADSPADNSNKGTNPSVEVSSPADSPMDYVGQIRTRPETGKVLSADSTEKAELAIEPAYPTDARAIAWRQRIDSQGIKSEAELIEVAGVTPKQARIMWQASFPESRAA